MVITTIMPDEILRAPVAVRPQSLKSAHVSANASHIEAELLTGLAAEHHAENVNKHNNNTRSTSNLTMADNRKDVNKNRPKCSFQVLNKIGQGGYGSVYTVEKNEGVDQRTVYAMKVRKLILTIILIFASPCHVEEVPSALLLESFFIESNYICPGSGSLSLSYN